jgi:hypothetical protein
MLRWLWKPGRYFLRHCKENDHGQRPVARKQGSKKTQKAETACGSGGFGPYSAQIKQADKAPALIDSVLA